MVMKRWMAVLTVVALTMGIGALVAAETGEATWQGIITDGMCGKKHLQLAPEKARECALRCLEKGDKLVLYDDKNDKTFDLSDQGKAKEFAGQSVVVKGAIGADGKSITVSSIQKSEPVKGGK